tara:strand:- start:56223 stop:56495 length:273 start_codon:yes stop_codon:yes gene_type:complete
MKTLFVTATLLTVVAPAAAFASQNCPDVPRDQWMSDTSITEKAKGMGYDVRSIKAENGCFEAYALDKTGKRVEVYFNPGTGDVVKVSGED